MARDVLVLREDEIRALLDMASCIDAVAAAFSSYSGGQAELPAIIHLDIPEHAGEIHGKAGYIHGGSIYAAKFASGFPGNAAAGLPTSDGIVLAFDAATGAPAALLFDNGFITDLRTGAAGGVAARYLAPQGVETVAIIGTGAQARYQLDALALERSFSEVRVWGRDEDKARGCVDELSERPGLPHGCRYVVSPTVSEAVEGADVIITVTAAQEPLVFSDGIRRGAHVTAVGSDGPDKRELDTETLGRADLLVVDSRAQCAQRGELHHALEDLTVSSAGTAIELGEITAGAHPGRTSEDQTTVCDLTGVGVQDVAAAELVLWRAAEQGLGERLSI